MKTSKNAAATEYHIFLKKYFPEHGNRLIKSRKKASSIRIVYPIAFFLFPLMIFSTFAFSLAFFKDSIVQFLAQTQFAESVSTGALQTIGVTLFAVGIVIALFSFFFGVFFGFAKARDLLFESESLEMNIRQLWALENINKDSKSRYNPSSSYYEKKNYAEVQKEPEF